MFKSLIFTGVVQGLFLISLIRGKKKLFYPDRLLMAWLLVVSLQLVFYYDNVLPPAMLPKFLQVLGVSLPLLSSALLYLYIQSLAFQSNFLLKKRSLHLLPFVLFNSVMFYFIFRNTNDVNVGYGFLQFSKQIPEPIQYLAPMSMALVCGGYALAGLLVLLKYQKSLPENYSYTEKINLNWLKWMVVSILFVFVVLFLVIRYGVLFSIINYHNLFEVVGAGLSLYVIFIGYFGLRQTTAFTGVRPISYFQEPITEQRKRYEKSGLDEVSTTQIFEVLVNYMNEEKPYLEEELSLSTLANSIQVSSNHLSQVINQKTTSNFFTFINAYRVEEAKIKLKDTAFEKYTILAIAYDCGFGSKASFNKIFKEQVGMTPSQFQKI